MLLETKPGFHSSHLERRFLSHHKHVMIEEGEKGCYQTDFFLIFFFKFGVQLNNDI